MADVGFLKGDIGGLPTWAWGAVIVGGIAAAYLVPKFFGGGTGQQQTTTTTTSDPCAGLTGQDLLNCQATSVLGAIGQGQPTIGNTPVVPPGMCPLYDNNGNLIGWQACSTTNPPGGCPPMPCPQIAFPGGGGFIWDPVQCKCVPTGTGPTPAPTPAPPGPTPAPPGAPPTPPDFLTNFLLNGANIGPWIAGRVVNVGGNTFTLQPGPCGRLWGTFVGGPYAGKTALLNPTRAGCVGGGPEEPLLVGQYPLASPASYMSVPGWPSPQTSLAAIAAKSGLSMERLLVLNPNITNPNAVYAGQRVRIS